MHTEITARIEAGKTDQEILDELSTETLDVRDPRPVTWAEIRSVLDDEFEIAPGVTERQLVKHTLAAAEAADLDVRSAVFALSTVGLSLVDADRLAMIDQLAVAGGWPDATRDKIKRLRCRTEPAYPTITLNKIANVRMQSYTETKIQQVAAAMRLAAAVEGATVDDVRAAAIGELS